MVALLGASVTGSVAAAAFPGVPRVAERILEQDWCKASSYRRAREAAAHAHLKLSQFARRNLQQSEQTAREHPRGCLLAVALTPIHPKHTPSHPAWNLGHAFGSCPRRPSPIPGDWRRRAPAAALALESRSERPIVIETALASAPNTARRQQLERACGIAATSRSVIVSLSLTALYPSASLSERVWAVAHFARWGWRAYFELH